MVQGSGSGEADEKQRNKANAKEFKRTAKENFKSILKYMGDSKCQNVQEAARDILKRGVDAYLDGNDDLLREMYLQVLKQLTQNPSENPRTSAGKGFASLGCSAK